MSEKQFKQLLTLLIGISAMLEVALNSTQSSIAQSIIKDTIKHLE
jgi:hypothetical protein